MATCCNGATYRRLERVARIISHSRGLLIPAKSERSLEYPLPLLPSLPFSTLRSSNHSTHTRIFCIFKLLHFAHFYDKQNFCTDIRHQRTPNHSPPFPFWQSPLLLGMQLRMERERETPLIIIKIHIVHISDMKGKQEVPSAAS